MDWISSADRAEIARVFAVYLKRVNNARSPSEKSRAVKYLYALHTAVLRRSSRKDSSRRNRRALSLALRDRCRKALNWELQGLITDALDAFSNNNRAPRSQNTSCESQKKYKRARASSEKGEV